MARIGLMGCLGTIPRAGALGAKPGNRQLLFSGPAMAVRAVGGDLTGLGVLFRAGRGSARLQGGQSAVVWWRRVCAARGLSG
jgi:hypothetical protein